MWSNPYPLTSSIDFSSPIILTYFCATLHKQLSHLTSAPLWPLVVMTDRFLFGKLNPLGP